MRRYNLTLFILLFYPLVAAVSMAGPYPPEAGVQGSVAIHIDDPEFVGWAAGYTDYTVGSDVDSTWQTPE